MKDERNYLSTREAARYLGLSARTLNRYRVLGRRTGVPPLRRPGALPARRPRRLGGGAPAGLDRRRRLGPRGGTVRSGSGPMRAPARTMPAAGRDRSGDALRIAAVAALAAAAVLTGTDAAIATTDTTFGTAKERVVEWVESKPGRGITEAVVISGMETIGELTGSESFDALIETPWETFEEQVVAAMAEGLALERPPAAGPIDVALACGVWEVAAARDDDGRLAVGAGSERRDRRTSLAGAGEAGRGRRGLAGRLRRGEGLLGGGGDPAGGHGGGRRRTQRQGRVLCPAGVAARRLRDADAGQRASAEGAPETSTGKSSRTAKAPLEGQALETIPIMEYVWERTNPERVNEELLRGRRVSGRTT